MTKSTEDIITIQFDGEKMEKKSTYEKKSRKNSWKYLRKISGKIRKNLRRSSRKNQGKIYETLFFSFIL